MDWSDRVLICHATQPPAQKAHFRSLIGLSAYSREFHRSIRNAWNPAFFSQSLEGYADLMNEGAEGLLRRLAKSAAKGEEIDIWRTLGDMTMAVVGSASFG